MLLFYGIIYGSNFGCKNIIIAIVSSHNMLKTKRIDLKLFNKI